jgi:hypothetical protein
MDTGAPALVFRYTAGITVTPGTAPATATAATLYVQGAGYATLAFTATTGTTPDDSGAHVYLVPGRYDPTDTGAGAKTVPESAECTGVLVLSDSELLCTVDLGQGLTGGVWTLAAPRTVADAATQSGGTAVTVDTTSSDAGFGPADVNLAVTGPGIQAGTVIASVSDPEDAVLSAPATADGTGVALAIGPRAVTDAQITSGGTTLTSASAGFTDEDAGRLVTGTGIRAGTSIVSVTDPSTVQLSRPATLSRTGTATVGVSAPVPDGPYSVTVVSDGGVDVQPGGSHADAGYWQTVVSSGSAFTVADY